MRGTVSAYARNEESKTGSRPMITFLLMKVRVMVFCTASSCGTRVVCITMRHWEKSVLFNETAIDQDLLQNFHIPDHISTDFIIGSKSKIVWLKTKHSTYDLTITTMFKLHVWQLPHFISSIWSKDWNRTCFILCTIIRWTSILQMKN